MANRITYAVQQINSTVGKEFIKAHHYTRGCHNGPMCWGLFDGEELIGVCAFATPSSENVRSSIFGPEHKGAVTELHRLVVLDGTPTNTESYFIRRALKGLKEYRPNIRAVISFADATEGHIGTIYQAANALYCGTSGRARFYRDQSGRLRHPRQNGINISPKVARERGWVPEMREGKHRYVFLVGSGPQKARYMRDFRLAVSDYPKMEAEREWLTA